MSSTERMWQTIARACAWVVVVAGISVVVFSSSVTLYAGIAVPAVAGMIVAAIFYGGSVRRRYYY